MALRHQMIEAIHLTENAKYQAHNQECIETIAASLFAQHHLDRSPLPYTVEIPKPLGGFEMSSFMRRVSEAGLSKLSGTEVGQIVVYDAAASEKNSLQAVKEGRLISWIPKKTLVLMFDLPENVR